jgi:cytochrome bd-type quinol oxidase subunit 2
MEEPSIFVKHENKIIIGSCVAAASLFIASFVVIATKVNNADNDRGVTPQMVKILILTMVGTILFSIAIFIVYNKHKEYTHIPLILMSTLAVGLSYAALCIAAISANSIG